MTDPAKAVGYLGCFTHTEGAQTTTRIVWTAKKLGAMVVWDAPDFERAMAFLQDWIDLGLVQ